MKTRFSKAESHRSIFLAMAAKGGWIAGVALIGGGLIQQMQPPKDRTSFSVSAAQSARGGPGPFARIAAALGGAGDRN